MPKSMKPRNVSELIRALSDGDNPHREHLAKITVQQALEMTATAEKPPLESQTDLRTARTV